MQLPEGVRMHPEDRTQAGMRSALRADLDPVVR